MQYNKKTDKFMYTWNNYKDNHGKCLRIEEHKQEGLLARFQTVDQSGFFLMTLKIIDNYFFLCEIIRNQSTVMILIS